MPVAHSPTLWPWSASPMAAVTAAFQRGMHTPRHTRARRVICMPESAKCMVVCMKCAESPLTRAHARIRRASLCTPDRRNDPMTEPGDTASECLSEATQRVAKTNPTCMHATRTSHRPGAPSSKGRPTRTSRLFRGSESGDSIWLLEAQEGVALERIGAVRPRIGVATLRFEA